METIDSQRRFWNAWNAENREEAIGDVSQRQAEIVLEWLATLRRRDLDIIEVGCGTGWFCPLLAEFGRVTGTDLSDEVLKRAGARWPHIRFLAGDFAAMSFEEGVYDVVVSLEVLSHVADQPAFIERLAALLKPGGVLLLATQNRTVLAGHCHVPPPAPGQLRNWVDRTELRALLESRLEVLRILSATPRAQKGFRRLLTSRKLDRALRRFVGDRWRDHLEWRGWGWTLLAMARKPAPSR